MSYKVKNYRKGGERENWQSIGIITVRGKTDLYMGRRIPDESHMGKTATIREIPENRENRDQARCHLIMACV